VKGWVGEGADGRALSKAVMAAQPIRPHLGVGGGAFLKRGRKGYEAGDVVRPVEGRGVAHCRDRGDKN